MSVEKVYDFDDGYGNWEDDNNPTTYSELHDFMANQNKAILNLAKRMWQPSTEYKVGDIVFSPDMENGKMARCVYAGTSGETEPPWGSLHNIQDNKCVWLMAELGGIKVGDSLVIKDNRLETNFNIGEYAKTRAVDDKFANRLDNLVFSLTKDGLVHVDIKEE